MKKSESAERKPLSDAIGHPSNAPTQEAIPTVTHSVRESEGQPAGGEREHRLKSRTRAPCTHDLESCQG